MKDILLERITKISTICHGKPTVRGMRIMVSTVLELLAAGMSIEELIEDYPELEIQDIYACLWYAAKVVNYEVKELAEA
ncbi:DUF433 domain-containing protein [Thermoflexibacter ruber]|uniref:Uncharacterized conserved protein, DUF433 family n=1 Tax=Thermoflexibacter ruber TaxID=1003 RepID=A0A1I2D2N4_9BACT|nr:DUF433 domain-containing protein [Thermoflexibacter ruber]SFE74769.1 Uncharacterized conserved protein, DUF433 family [Thermoflexibacter ruber]